jgi:hypothetical protein
MGGPTGGLFDPLKPIFGTNQRPSGLLEGPLLVLWEAFLAPLWDPFLGPTKGPWGQWKDHSWDPPNPPHPFVGLRPQITYLRPIRGTLERPFRPVETKARFLAGDGA